MQTGDESMGTEEGGWVCAPSDRNAPNNVTTELPKTMQLKTGQSRHSLDQALRSSSMRRPSLASAQGNDKDRGAEKMKGTFVDANAMKEKVRQNLTRPQISVRDYYKESGVWQAMAKSTLFEYISLGLVAFNALWISIDTDLNGAELLMEAHPVFQAAENTFCFCFSFELLVRFMAFKYKRYVFKDPWFLFDFFMVTMMVLETWVMTLVLLIVGTGGGGAGNASILRIARLMRLSRMARMARLLRALPELMIMIRGMMAATRSVFFTLCLLAIVLYVFAIAFTQMTENMECGTKYFSSVPESMFTLLVHGTLLDNVGSIAKELGREQVYIAGMFFLFVLIAALTVMNMLIGVLCEVVNAVAATEKEEMLVTYVNQKLQRVVSLLDTDGGGTISKKEFMQILENTDAVRCLQDVGVDVVGLVDFADFIFETDDMSADGEEEEEGLELDFGKFMEVVLQLRGSNNATVKDIVDLRKFLRNSISDINRTVASIKHNTEFTRATLARGSPELPKSNHHKSPKASKDSNHNDLGKQSPNRSSLESVAECFHPTSRISDHLTTNGGKAIVDGVDKNGTTVAIPQPLAGFAQPISYIAEGGGMPVPLQPSASVHLLRPDRDDSVAASAPWSHFDRSEAGFPPALKGQWYPYEPVEVQLRSVRKPEVVLDRRSPELRELSSIGRSPELRELSSIAAKPLVAGSFKDVEFRPMEAVVQSGNGPARLT